MTVCGVSKFCQAMVYMESECCKQRVDTMKQPSFITMCCGMCAEDSMLRLAPFAWPALLSVCKIQPQDGQLQGMQSVTCQSSLFARSTLYISYAWPPQLPKWQYFAAAITTRGGQSLAIGTAQCIMTWPMQIWIDTHLLNSSNDKQGLENNNARTKEVQPKGTVTVALQEGHQEAKSNKYHDCHLQHAACQYLLMWMQSKSWNRGRFCHEMMSMMTMTNHAKTSVGGLQAVWPGYSSMHMASLLKLNKLVY